MKDMDLDIFKTLFGLAGLVLLFYAHFLKGGWGPYGRLNTKFVGWLLIIVDIIMIFLSPFKSAFFFALSLSYIIILFFCGVFLSKLKNH